MYQPVDIVNKFVAPFPRYIASITFGCFYGLSITITACSSPSTIGNSGQASSTSAGAPSAPLAVKTEQPDGTTIDIYLRGDEHISWHETSEGYSVIKQQKDKFWYYATCENNHLSQSRYRIGESLPANWPKHLRPGVPNCGAKI